MKSVVAILLALAGGCAFADVYKWTDENGDVHYSETASPPANAQRFMTEQQIQHTEQADRARPQVPVDTDSSIDEEVAQRASECQRFKNLRDEYLMRMDKPAQQAINARAMGLGYPMGIVGGDGTANMPAFTEIEAGIRQNCGN